jgi:hypothetical protein
MSHVCSLFVLRRGVRRLAACLAVATLASLAFGTPARAVNCPLYYACQFADYDYGGARDQYRYGFDNFAYATHNAGTCIARSRVNWKDCARSTYNNHTSVSVYWFVDSGCSGASLLNTPGSGSRDLANTWMGNFFQKLSSIMYLDSSRRCY